MDHHWHLRGIDWLGTLPQAAADTVRRASESHVYRTGEAVFNPTQNPRYVYLLEEGLVRILRVSASGHELTLGYVRPGELFGAVSVMTGSARESFAEAKTRARVLAIPKGIFLTTVRASNSVLYEVTKRVGQRLIRCQSRVEDLVFRDVRMRLARMLLELAREYGHETDRGLAVGLSLTQEEMATLIGSTRQSVNALLREMRVAGLVAHQGRDLLITDPRRLRSLLGSRRSPSSKV
jgi:CRP/FNR family cyclic AMP-dependent transcriptional regulator